MDGPKLKPAQLDSIEADDDDCEPTKEEIMEDLRVALRDAMAGFQGQDALEFLDELERESTVDADES